MSDESSPKGGSFTQSRTAQIDQVCDRFELAWQSGTPPQIEEFLREPAVAAGGVRLRELLVELIRIDLERRWRTPPTDTVSSRAASERRGGV